MIDDQREYIPGGFWIFPRQSEWGMLYDKLKGSHKLIMLELIKRAQFKDGYVICKGEKIDLKRGQLAASYNQIVKWINDPIVSKEVARNAIRKLKQSKFLSYDEEKARKKKGLLITLIDYDFYQNPENYRAQPAHTSHTNAKKCNSLNTGENSGQNTDENIVDNGTNPIIPTDNSNEENEDNIVSDNAENIVETIEGENQEHSENIDVTLIKEFNNVKEGINIKHHDVLTPLSEIDFKDTEKILLHHWTDIFEFRIGILNQSRIEIMNSYLDDGITEDALKIAILRCYGKHTPENYLIGILNNWLNDEIKTVEDVERADKEHEQNKPTHNQEKTGEKKIKKHYGKASTEVF